MSVADRLGNPIGASAEPGQGEVTQRSDPIRFVLMRPMDMLKAFSGDRRTRSKRSVGGETDGVSRKGLPCVVGNPSLN